MSTLKLSFEKANTKKAEERLTDKFGIRYDDPRPRTDGRCYFQDGECEYRLVPFIITQGEQQEES